MCPELLVGHAMAKGRQGLADSERASTGLNGIGQRNHDQVTEPYAGKWEQGDTFL